MQKTAVIFSIAERTIQLSNTSESFYVNCFLALIGFETCKWTTQDGTEADNKQMPELSSPTEGAYYSWEMTSATGCTGL
jgi:hypothetical protein